MHTLSFVIFKYVTRKTHNHIDPETRIYNMTVQSLQPGQGRLQQNTPTASTENKICHAAEHLPNKSGPITNKVNVHIAAA